MKKRVVAIVLSLTMCMATVLQASAAEFVPESVETFTDTSDTDAAAELPEVTEVPQVTETPQVTEVPEVTETPQVTEVPSEAEEIDVFTAGDEEQTTSETKTDENLSDGGAEEHRANVRAAFSAEAKEGSVTVLAEDWKKVGENQYKLVKTIEEEAQQAAETVQQAAAVEEPAAVDEAAEETEGEVSGEEIETFAEVPEEADVAQQAEGTENTSSQDTYFTENDGLVLINTVYKDEVHTGYYMFDENGVMLTGEQEVSAEMPGNFMGTDETVYFADVNQAEVYDSYKGESVSPYTSTYGKQIVDTWVWNTDKFQYYDKEGKLLTVSEVTALYKAEGKFAGYFKINGEYYCLKEDGKPRTGNYQMDVNGKKIWYYFNPSKDASGIPGAMFHDGWRLQDDKRGERWFYYNTGSKNIDDIGKRWAPGTVVTKLDTAKKGNYEYLLDKNGFILKGVQRKAANGSIYCSDKYGRIYKNRLVRCTSGSRSYRYYFTGNGKRATWKNRWMKCSGAGNRYYYFGSCAGRVSEKYGWQKIIHNGKFYGWFYFDKNGNHYISRITSEYYFDSVGRLAGGLRTVNNKKYIFQRSDINNRRGQMYKNTLVYYNKRYYYATSTGALRKSGWQKISGKWYYLEDYKVVTNKFMKKNGVNGYLDSKGVYTTGWVIVSDAQNLVRYIDPDGNGYVTNKSKWINGLLYYFDKNGYRINDVTNRYSGPYRLKVDRVNGVMTVYNEAMNVPLKTIRVSVGNPWTPTPADGRWHRLTPYGRWQMLMGPSYGQYGTHVDGAGQGGIFVHSVACGSPNSYNLPAAQYNKLGSPASHGCIRACVADAKWVYENCGGSYIYIYDGKYTANESMKGPLGRKALVPLRYPYNFDPTDPAV